MENVTKALLIAAAVIVVLVIIGLGMYYLNVGRKAMQSTGQLDSAEVQSYNSEFTSYAGVQNGSNVIELMNRVNRHNSEKIADPDYQISFNGTSGTEHAGGALTAKAKTELTANKDSKLDYDPAGVADAYTKGTAVKTSRKYYLVFDYTAAGYLANIRVYEQ